MNTLTKNYVCLTAASGKTIKQAVFTRNDEEVLIVFTDGTFSRLKAEGYDDGDASIENVSSVCNGAQMLAFYPIDLLREIVPADTLKEWIASVDARKKEEIDRKERADRELYAELHARFGTPNTRDESTGL